MEKLPSWQSSQAGSLSRKILRCICPGQSVSQPTIVMEPRGVEAPSTKSRLTFTDYSYYLYPVAPTTLLMVPE